MKLLFRPRPIQGESWPGYLLRLTNGNQYEGLNALSKSLGMTPAALIATHPLNLLPTFGIEIPMNTPPPLSNEMVARASLFLAGRPLHAKVCARCMGEAETPYLRSDWDRAFAFTCHKHQVFLAESCHHCGIRLSHLRRRVDRCDCGFELRRNPSPSVEFNFEQVLKVCGLQGLLSGRTPTFGHSNQQELGAMIFLRRLLRLDSGVYLEGHSRDRRLDAYVSLDEIRRVSSWFRDWPNEFLRRAVEIQGKTDKPISTIFFTRSIGTSAALPEIKDALKLLHRNRKQRPKQTGLESTLLASREFVGIRFVMDATGSTYDAVQYWIKRGWLGSVRVDRLSSSQKKYFIHRNAASRAIQLMRSTSSIRELSNAVGLNGTALRYLAKSGHLQSIRCGQAEWNIRLLPAEVFALARNLLALAKRGRASEDCRMLLSDALIKVGEGNPESLKPFIHALLQRHISLRIFDAPPTNLEQVSLKVSDLESWRFSHRENL